MGDRTNLVMMLAGELLKKAEYLLTMGLHPSEVVLGYELARDKALEELESQSSHRPALPSLPLTPRPASVDRQNSRNSPQQRLSHPRSPTDPRFQAIRI